MKKNNEKKTACYIVGLLFTCFLIIVVFFNTFPLYLQSSSMRNNYAKATTDDGKWQVYLIPDSYGFVRGYLIPDKAIASKKITVLSKEYGTFDKATKKANESQQLNTPAEKSILKEKIYYDFIEAESGAEEEVEIPVIIKWTDQSNQHRESKATIKYDKWNAYKWFAIIKSKLGMAVF